MASALRASRDFVAQALARVRSGAAQYERGIGQPGPEIKVEPFDAHNVSTPAALVKLGTSIAAARRHRANFDAAQQDVAMAREKTREQIALLRAQAAYAMGTGRQPAARATGLTPYQVASLDLANQRLGIARGAAGRVATSHDLAGAKAALREIDANVARETDAQVQRQMAAYEAEFRPRANSSDPKIRRAALLGMGINATELLGNPAYGGTSAQQRLAAVEQGFANLRRKATDRIRATVQAKYQPDRERYQAVINAASGAPAPSDVGETDPLGILGAGVP